MSSETDFDYKEADTENKEVLQKSFKKHICPYAGCQSSFNRPWKLNRHIYTHTKQRPFKCDYPGCSKDYTNKSHLDRHKCTSHKQNKPVPVHIPCPYPECNKVFMNKCNVKRHCNIHKSKNSYDCIHCGASFKIPRQLKDHLNIHLNIKTFVCETCKESFETQRALKFHKRKHKIYSCEYQECQEKFNTWNGVRKHLKTCHFTFYKCDSCGKSFKNKWTMTEHVLSHLPDDKRDIFVCPHNDCERFYFHQRNLDHHLKSFHQDINHKCEIENCGQSFVKRMGLKKHQRLLHSDIKIIKDCPRKEKLPRKPRKDKGQSRKSMAAMLSGIILPYHIDKSLAHNNITPEVVESIQNMKDALLKENIIQENEIILSENL